MRKIKIIINCLLHLPTRLFSKISIFALIDKSQIDPTVAILYKSRIYWSTIQKYTYINDHCWIIKSSIGSFCSIASNVMIGGGKHPLNFVSTSPVFYSKKNSLKTCFFEVNFEEYEKTIIGNDVWIGANVFIKGGVKVGDGAVIGAHAVVTKDIEPYSIVVGNPAKMVKKRFDEATIQKLLRSKWWDYSDDFLKEKAHKFDNVEVFLQSVL